MDIKVNILGFATFADFFFDGFFVDWFVQSKINDSLRRVEGAMSKINYIFKNLSSRHEALNNQLKESENEVRIILESSYVQ